MSDLPLLAVGTEQAAQSTLLSRWRLLPVETKYARDEGFERFAMGKGQSAGATHWRVELWFESEKCEVQLRCSILSGVSVRSSRPQPVTVQTLPLQGFSRHILRCTSPSRNHAIPPLFYCPFTMTIKRQSIGLFFVRLLHACFIGCQSYQPSSLVQKSPYREETP